MSSPPRDATEFTDVELIRAHRSGEPAAFAELFRRYEARLRALCHRYLRDRWLAEDVVQETFLRLLQAQADMDEGFNVGAWLHRIAVNQCIDEQRRARHRGRPEAVDEVDERSGGLGSVHPEAVLDARVTHQQLVEAIGHLPTRQRRVLVRRDVHGMSYAAIAAAESLTVAAVHGVLHRARERVKREYAAMVSPSGPASPCTAIRLILQRATLDGLNGNRARSVARHVASCPECSSHRRPAAARAKSLLSLAPTVSLPAA
jgi:RNA polymerase sigma-70 factor (ECF subfamily)